MTEYSFGCLPSPFDERDFALASYLAPVGLPTSLSYREFMSPVKSQGGLGSCVGFAGTAVTEQMHRAADLSEMWLYHRCKLLDHYPLEGTYPRIALQVMQDGVPEETFWPYIDRYPPGYEAQPGAAVNADKYKIGTYAMASYVDELKAGLYQHGPMLLAIQISENYQESSRTGVFPMPTGRWLGGHAVALVGYDDEKQWYVIKNSWGNGWGDNGYGYIPYDVMPKLFWEAWSVVDENTVPLRWPDLEGWAMPPDDLLSQDRVWQERIMQGYPDGTFRPGLEVTTHQVGTVAVRLGLLTENPWNEASDYSLSCTRGFVHEKLPQLTFLEERWTEPITRFQLMLLIGRNLRGV